MTREVNWNDELFVGDLEDARGRLVEVHHLKENPTKVALSIGGDEPFLILAAEGADYLQTLLGRFRGQACDYIESKMVKKALDLSGFEKRWAAMGNSREGGWTVEQEQTLAVNWHRVPFRMLADGVMVTRRAQARGRIAVLGARGAVIRAAMMGIITVGQAEEYAGVSLRRGHWPEYEPPEEKAPSDG